MVFPNFDATEEGKARASQAPKKHGAYSIQAGNLSDKQISELKELEEGLSTRAGIYRAALRNAALNQMMVEALVCYVASEIASGMPYEEIKSTGNFSRFSNAYDRALGRLLQLTPEESSPKFVSELAHIQEVISAS